MHGVVVLGELLGRDFDLGFVEAVEAGAADVDECDDFVPFVCDEGVKGASRVAAVGAGGGDEVWFEGGLFARSRYGLGEGGGHGLGGGSFFGNRISELA
jgi:hypothetical protein